MSPGVHHSVEQRRSGIGIRAAMPKVAQFLRLADPWLKFLVLAGTVIYLIEISLGNGQATNIPQFLLWTDYAIGLCFTSEYVLRWMDDVQDHYGWHYPHSAMGLVDLVSIIPFWAGFILSPQWMQLVRALRVFRLLKFFRYSRSLQLVALGFYRAAPALQPLCFSMSIIGLFCTVAVYEAERGAQPDKFRNLFDAMYFTMVTVATVGYGDITPVTAIGRIVVMFTFVTGLALFAGILGVMGSSFFKVMEEEIDPSIDPIEEFRKERERHLLKRAGQRQPGDTQALRH